jgi:hypothetical protein
MDLEVGALCICESSSFCECGCWMEILRGIGVIYRGTTLRVFGEKATCESPAYEFGRSVQKPVDEEEDSLAEDIGPPM